MALYPLTEGLDAVSSVSDAVAPVVKDAVDHKYETAQIERIQKYEHIMELIKENPAEPHFKLLRDFLGELFNAGGEPLGDLGSNSITVPVGVFDKLVSRYSKSIQIESESK